MRDPIVEVGASVADLGTLLPIVAGLALTNGVDAAAALTFAGALSVAAGVFYRIPIPVQPIKAAAAIAIATRASPQTIAAAGVVLGAILVVLALTRGARLLVRLFPKPVIRGNQLGVGILLVIAAVALVRRTSGGDLVPVVVGCALVGVLVATERARRLPVGVLMVAGGIAWSIVVGARIEADASVSLPVFAPPGWDAAWAAFTLLVIPQLPLTLGNAVVGTADLTREYHGARAHRVTESRLCLSSGAANIVAGLFGGIPLCHGSSGATAYERFGARTAAPVIALGAVLVVAGIAFGADVLSWLGLIPAPVLGALLAYTGIRHAALIGDLRGASLGIAITMGAAGALTRNLTIGMAVGLPLYLILIAGRRVTRSARA